MVNTKIVLILIKVSNDNLSNHCVVTYRTIIVVLALYNLSVNSNGLGRHGYFHWRTHISLFIDKNWNNLLESYV